MVILRSIACILSLLLYSCTSSSKTYILSVDPAFYSINAEGKEKNILAFLTDLTSEISSRGDVQLQLQSVNWDTLYEGLEKKQYDAVISGMQPYNFTEQLYQFSDVIIETGPVLMTSENSAYPSLSKLSGQEVGITSNQANMMIQKSYPKIILRMYDSTPKMLGELQNKKIQGAIVDLIPAIGYAKGLFSGSLKISSKPLTQEGLRLIALKNHDQNLIKIFSKALSQMQKEGYLESLKQKWDLAP